MFARHFEAQSYDAAGKVGVQLQKVILFLVFSSVLSLIDLRVSTIVGVAVMVAIYAAGVHGAARRRRCALACYSVLMSIYVALTVALLIFLAVMTIYAHATAPLDNADSSDVATPDQAAATTSMAASMMPALPPVVHNMLARPEPLATAAPTSAPADEASDSEAATEEGETDVRVSVWYYILTSLYFFACMVTFALKLYTIKLATEMHKHLTVAERAGNHDSGARSSCCRTRVAAKSEPVEAATSGKAAPTEVVYVPACYPPGVNDDVTPGSSSYPPNCYQPLNQAAEH
jgi:hypothetical protein